MPTYDYSDVLSDYQSWLFQTGRSANTRRAFYTGVERFFAFVSVTRPDWESILTDADARDRAVSDYQHHLQKELQPASIRAMLNAVNNFFRYIGLGNTRVKMESSIPSLGHTLTEEEQRRFLEELEKLKSCRDRAVAKILFYCGIRTGECAALNVSDIETVGKTIRLHVGSHHVAILPETVSSTLFQWLAFRDTWLQPAFQRALFLNGRGKRLSISNIDSIVRKIGWAAHFQVSAEVLRRTYHQRAERHLMIDHPPHDKSGIVVERESLNVPLGVRPNMGSPPTMGKVDR
jgi:site-specific recombinase XerD